MKSQNFVILGQFRSKNGLLHKNAIFSKTRCGVVRDNSKDMFV